jgi:hypothetical protein
MKAWIVTVESTTTVRHEVVGILRASKSPTGVKEHLEMLYTLLFGSGQAQLDIAHYRHPSPAHTATISDGPLVSCGGRRYLMARRAIGVELSELAGTVALKWRHRDFNTEEEQRATLKLPLLS